jgi:hypothetical protein
MAQADQTIQNATFPTVRADINDNLAALFSANSGNTAPTVTVAFQDWIDTSGANALWKKRNAANSAWITLGAIIGNTIAFEGTLPSQSGNSGKYLSTDGSDASWESVLSLGSIITAGTSVASTSGTSVDFTGIPSWVKRVTVMFNGVSTNGGSPVQVQIGAGSVQTTSYLSSSMGVGGTITSTANSTTGFRFLSDTANATLHGKAIFDLLGSNVWVSQGAVGLSNGAVMYFFAGSVTLGGTLDRIRITTVNGTDTFDAGSINILYEG